MDGANRILNPHLRSKVMSATEAALLIPSGANVGMSGFTGAGYPKAVPTELATVMRQAHAAGDDFRIGLWTGASTAPDADGVLAERIHQGRLKVVSDCYDLGTGSVAFDA